MIRGNEKGTNMLIDFAILINRNVIVKETEEILKYKTLNNMITGHVENKNKSRTGNNRGNCNHIKIIHKIPEKPSRKARNQRTAENNHTGPRTHTSETTNVKVQKSVMGNNITCNVCINHRITTKLYALKTCKYHVKSHSR